MPDALTIANTVATIVQLLAIFKQERGEKALSDHREFEEWLAYHRHEELKQALANNDAMRSEVDKLLRQDHADIMAKLNRVNEVLMSLVGSMEEFKGLTRAINPAIDFSDQALSILRLMVSAHTELQLRRFGKDFGLSYITTDDPPIEYEPTFLRDDMQALEAAGLIAVLWTDGSSTTYRITRQAVRFVEALDSKKGRLSS